MIQHKKNIWLCDLTHTYQGIAMRQMPLGIGLIASFCQKELKGKVGIQLFKFVDQLVDAVKGESEPFIVGFSNFMWNQNLNLEVSRRIKARFPEAVIIFGGLNFPREEEEQLIFFQTSPWVDFYIPYEGERAFAGLATLLIEHDGDVKEVKEMVPAGTVFLSDDKLITGEVSSRINIAEIPSPYLDGFFDEYFKQLNPLIQTVRGCPFSCAYCSEGGEYWNKVSRRNEKVVAEELEYIAKHCDSSQILFISDANFAQYSQDIKLCEVIAYLQDNYSWPWQMNVTTGKNKKERVLRAADITRNAFGMSASVQSTDPGVLRNIKRQNVSLETIISLIKESKSGEESVCELILALPGDSLETHFKTLQDVVDTGIRRIIPLQFMLLPAMELNSKKSRGKYQMRTQFRIVAHCFGRYPWLDGEEDILTAEVGEICVESNTLSFKDYLECRKIHLTIAIFYNDHLLEGFITILTSLGLSVFEFLRGVQEKALRTKLKDVYSDFVQETKEELWDSPREILEFIRRPGVVEKYRQGRYGSKVLSKHRTFAIIRYMDLIIDIGAQQLKEVIHNEKTEKINNTPYIFDFIDELKRLMTYKLINFLDTEVFFEGNFNYSMTDFLNKEIPLERVIESKQFIRFEHNSNQKKIIKKNKDFFGEGLDGLSNMFSKIPLSKLFRIPAVKQIRLSRPVK